ncbi:MAG TPA: hypothetical protein VK054_04180 [Beutenbergiaceae bacterium]|nr:hypothetical protein [Beutenbergiaceae bacterium]
MTNEPVVYETTLPRYIVEECDQDNNWTACGSSNALDRAKEKADRLQRLFPQARYRVVDTTKY